MSERTHAPSKSDSPTKTCTATGCSRPLRARGLCSTHYNQASKPNFKRQCSACGRDVAKDQQYVRRVVCSPYCRAYLQFGMTSCVVPATHPTRSSPVPASHPSRVPTSCAVPPSHPSRVGPQDCRWCGQPAGEWMGRYCSTSCRARAKRVRRRGRESDGRSYSWTHVMRVLLLLDGRCAYCCEPIVGSPDPDHVIPVSRHGSNGNGNILPACRPCNGDKRDLLLHEWAEDRARRGKPPVRTTFDRSLPAFAHLLPDVLTSSHAA